MLVYWFTICSQLADSTPHADTDSTALPVIDQALNKHWSNERSGMGFRRKFLAGDIGEFTLREVYGVRREENGEPRPEESLTTSVWVGPGKDDEG